MLSLILEKLGMIFSSLDIILNQPDVISSISPKDYDSAEL
jgi:hypothetical protein